MQCIPKILHRDAVARWKVELEIGTYSFAAVQEVGCGNVVDYACLCSASRKFFTVTLWPDGKWSSRSAHTASLLYRKWVAATWLTTPAYAVHPENSSP